MEGRPGTEFKTNDKCKVTQQLSFQGGELRSILKSNTEEKLSQYHKMRVDRLLFACLMGTWKKERRGKPKRGQT
jgi:hypothetical protein